ncbi:23S rRNA (guanosine(2251)-2'-O)-methyltransferase RlmB [bacterium]|nr:23S rRNA (guanosine(2251)-2'-O)-methyltransferase RlmB [bacterium]
MPRVNRHTDLNARVEVLSDDDLLSLVAKLEVPALLLILDGVTDPHNLGACLRAADGAGAHAVVVPKDRAVAMTPTVRTVSCGAAEHIPLVQVTNLARTLKKLQDAGVWIVGLVVDGDRTIYDCDLAGPTALVLGAEGPGIRRLTRESCDFLASLPMLGAVESLNVSVAAGICLYEAVRQRAITR